MTYELRPLTLAEILDAAFRLVQTEWRTLVGLSLLAQIPIVLLGLQADWLFDPFTQPSFDEDSDPREIFVQIGLIGGGLGLLYTILYPFIASAVTASVGNFYLGRRFALGDAARAGLRNLLRLIGSYLIWMLAYFGVFITVIVVAAVVVGFLGVSLREVFAGLGAAGIVIVVLLGIAAFVGVALAMLYAGVVASLLPPVTVLESLGVVGTVGRAFELASAAKLRTIGVLITAGMIVGLPIGGAQMLIGFVPVVGLLVWALFQAAGFAFTTSVATVLYFDLRCRAENYDLELLAQQVEAGPGLGGR